jgi:hypothetical protein
LGSARPDRPGSRRGPDVEAERPPRDGARACAAAVLWVRERDVSAMSPTSIPFSHV